MIEKLSKNLIAVAIIIAGVLIAGAVFYVNLEKGEKIAGFLTAQQAAEKTINFINQHLVEPGMVVSLISVTEERGLYKVSLKVGEQEHNSYVTKDGKLLFLEGIDMEKEVSDTQPADTQPAEQQEGGDVARPFSDEQLETLAKCLSEKGAKFYGAYWCRWCNKQKEIFGQAVRYLPYIECADKETQGITSQCQEAGISGFPTWEFFGEKMSGFKTAEELSQLAKCPL